MNYFTRLFSQTIITLLVAGVAVTASASGTHSHSHGSKTEPMVFEPTETEFGAYMPEMEATKTIAVTLSDKMTFTPNVIKVKLGEVIEFRHTNEGKLQHEFVLGTEPTLAEHAVMMQKFPNMEHEEPYMIHVAPGEEGKMKWKFTKAGEFAFGCLVPGHFEAGMKGKIVVE